MFCLSHVRNVAELSLRLFSLRRKKKKYSALGDRALLVQLVERGGDALVGFFPAAFAASSVLRLQLQN